MWFRNWSKNERKYFGQVLLEKEQKVSADTLSNTMHKLTLNSVRCEDDEGPSLFEVRLIGGLFNCELFNPDFIFITFFNSIPKSDSSVIFKF